MNKYINKEKRNISMKRIIFIFLIFLSIFNCYSTDIQIINNETGFGGNQVDDSNLLYIDFSNMATLIAFIIMFIMVIISFLFIVSPVNAFILLFMSIVLMANGFNIFLSFVIMLISILLITKSK